MFLLLHSFLSKSQTATVETKIADSSSVSVRPFRGTLVETCLSSVTPRWASSSRLDFGPFKRSEVVFAFSEDDPKPAAAALTFTLHYAAFIRRAPMGGVVPRPTRPPEEGSIRVEL